MVVNLVCVRGAGQGSKRSRGEFEPFVAGVVVCCFSICVGEADDKYMRVLTKRGNFIAICICKSSWNFNSAYCR